MPHDISLISTLAVGLALALALGYLVTRLRMPPRPPNARAGWTG